MSLLHRCLQGGVACDSRLVQQGQVFFALKGERTDGHDHLDEALARGASAAVVCEKTQPCDLELIHVADPLQTLQDLARERLRQLKCEVLALTGSLGKTTIKEFAARLIGEKFVTFASPGNRNSQVGLPLSILEAPEGTQVIILEMGMSGPGHIAQLVQIAAPRVALLSKIAPVHAEFFDSMEELKRAKLEIFSHPDTQLAIVPHDLTFSTPLVKRTFSTTSPAADLFLKQAGDQLTLFERGEEILTVPWHLPGVHNPYNFLGAVALARAVGVEWIRIGKATPELTLPRMRFEVRKKGGITLINDAYNAAAPSVCAALQSLPAPQNKGRKIGVLSEMLEMGDFHDQCHREVGEEALRHLDHLVCIGPGSAPLQEVWREAGRPLDYFESREGVLEHIRSLAGPDDVILFKGGRAYALDQLVEAF